MFKSVIVHSNMVFFTIFSLRNKVKDEDFSVTRASFHIASFRIVVKHWNKSRSSMPVIVIGMHTVYHSIFPNCWNQSCDLRFFSHSTSSFLRSFRNCTCYAVDETAGSPEDDTTHHGSDSFT